MGRFLRNIAVVAVVLVATTGCFKKVTTDTTLRIKVLEQSDSGGITLPAEGCSAYIYYTEKEDWTVASYEDAVAKVITNTVTGEQRSVPDGESEPYEMEESENTPSFSSISTNFSAGTLQSGHFSGAESPS